MDKQREEFDVWYGKKPKNWIEAVKYNKSWLAWQQAQKVAVPKLSDKVVCVIEREVENQLIASGIDADPFRLDGEKIFNAIIEAWEKK